MPVFTVPTVGVKSVCVKVTKPPNWYDKKCTKWNWKKFTNWNTVVCTVPLILYNSESGCLNSFFIPPKPHYRTLQEIRTLNVCASPLPASRARTAPRACSARRGSACQAASQMRTAPSTSAACKGSACVSICAFFSTGFPGHTSWQVEIYFQKKMENFFLYN